MDAARATFAARGYDGASISDIAQRAGVAKSVVYDHFPSKAALHKAIVESETRLLQSQVARAVAANTAGTVRNRVKAGIDAYFTFVEERPAAWSLLVRDPPADPELLEYHAGLQRSGRDAVAGLFTEGVEDAEERQRGEMTAVLLRAAITGLAHWWYEHPEVPRERIVETVADWAFPSTSRARTKPEQVRAWIEAHKDAPPDYA